MKNRTVGLLFILLIVILIVAGINALLLWDETGIGLLLNLLVSLVGLVFATIFLFIRSGIRWILISKILAVTTMLLPFVNEYFRYSYPLRIGELLLPFNLVLIPVSIGSIVVIYQRRTINPIAK